jgi:hypothetical protein
MTYYEEFPEFPAVDMPEEFMMHPWRDISWHNDACPCFERSIPNSERVVRVYVDYVEPENREFEGVGRFVVYDYADAEGDMESPCFSSDSLVAALDHVGFLCGEVAR